MMTHDYGGGRGSQTNDYVIKMLLFCYIFSAIFFKIVVKFVLNYIKIQKKGGGGGGSR